MHDGIKTKIINDIIVNTECNETLFGETVSNIDQKQTVEGAIYKRPKSNFHDHKSTLANLFSTLENNNSRNYNG